MTDSATDIAAAERVVRDYIEAYGPIPVRWTSEARGPARAYTQAVVNRGHIEIGMGAVGGILRAVTDDTALMVGWDLSRPIDIDGTVNIAGPGRLRNSDILSVAAWVSEQP